MKVTDFAIRNNLTTWTILTMLLLGGLSAYFTLPRAEDPGFIIRTALVQTVFPGASPERVESLVTSPLEKVIQEMPEIEFIKSESKTGLSIIHVQIKEIHTEIQPIWDKLRRKVDSVAGGLPQGVIGPKVNDEFGDVFGITLTVRGEGFSYSELKDVADQIRDKTLFLSEAAKVEVFGSQEERIFVEYKNSRLAAAGASPAVMRGILAEQNILTSGGSLKIGREEVPVEPSGNFQSLEDLARTVIQVPGSPDVFYLGDFVEIRRGYETPARSYVHGNGTRALALAISMREGGNIIELGRQVEELLAKLQTQYPIGIDFDLVVFQPDVVQKKIDDFVVNILQAILIVLVVMVLSLGFRSVILVASLIPASMLTTLLAMKTFEIGLDQVSLAALIISLGMLVDNAIVMSESILVQAEKGKSVYEACLAAASELKIPLLTSSLTTIAAFLPIYLAESSTGEYTASLFKVVGITLLSSWVLSLTMIPLFCVVFLKIQKKSKPAEAPVESRLNRLYGRVLSLSIERKGLSLVGIFVAFLGSLTLAGFVPQVFFPSADKPVLTIKLELPSSSQIEATRGVVKQLEDKMHSIKSIKSWVSYIGNGGPPLHLCLQPKSFQSQYCIHLFECF